LARRQLLFYNRKSAGYQDQMGEFARDRLYLNHGFLPD
jgi:hypothetical protein